MNSSERKMEFYFCGRSANTVIKMVGGFFWFFHVDSFRTKITKAVINIMAIKQRPCNGLLHRNIIIIIINITVIVAAVKGNMAKTF